MTQRPDPWIIDPDDPRAPPQEIWDAMNEEQRQRVVDELPSEFPPSEARPPEGDEHTEAVYGARTALRRFFGKTGKRIYVGTNLPVYYPGKSMFSPDVIAVTNVETHQRSSWIVSKEGKGLDLAIEVIVLGNRRKDVERNVAYYAELGIREYFVFDRPKLRLQGFRLRETGRVYDPIVPQHGYGQNLRAARRIFRSRSRGFGGGPVALPHRDKTSGITLRARIRSRLGRIRQGVLARSSLPVLGWRGSASHYPSEVLALDLLVERERLRFYAGDAALPGADDLIDKLEGFVDGLEARLAAAEQRAEAEAQRAEAEAQRARENEERLRQALAELERLKKSRE